MAPGGAISGCHSHRPARRSRRPSPRRSRAPPARCHVGPPHRLNSKAQNSSELATSRTRQPAIPGGCRTVAAGGACGRTLRSTSWRAEQQASSRGLNTSVYGWAPEIWVCVPSCSANSPRSPSRERRVPQGAAADPQAPRPERGACPSVGPWDSRPRRRASGCTSTQPAASDCGIRRGSLAGGLSHINGIQARVRLPLTAGSG